MAKLIINPVGGLANRMRAVVSGVSLSQKLDMEFPEIVWSLNSDLYCGFDTLFETDNIARYVKNISSIKDLFFYDIPRKKNLFLANVFQYGRYGMKLTDWDKLPLYSENLESLENIIRETTNTVLIRSGVTYYPFSKELYRSLLIPKRIYTEEAIVRTSAAKGKIIGLHIRRTDNVVSIKYSPLHLFIEAVEREIAKDSAVMFYIASDDPDVKNHFKNLFGERIIVSDKTTERNTVEGIKEALTEIVILSRCFKVYGSYWSSFSEAAAMLGDTTLVQLKID